MRKYLTLLSILCLSPLLLGASSHVNFSTVGNLGGYQGTDWVSYTMTITGSGSNPTKGTVVIDEARWRRVGDSMEIRYSYQQSAGGSAGSGTYLFALPSGYSADSSKITASTNGNYPLLGPANTGNATGLGTTHGIGWATLYDSTHISLVQQNNTDLRAFQLYGSGMSGDFSGAASISFTVIVPISGWSSTSPQGSGVVTSSYATEAGLSASDISGHGTCTNATFKSWVEPSGFYCVDFRYDSGTLAGTTYSINLPSGKTINTTAMGSARRLLRGEILRVSAVANLPSSSVGPFKFFYDGSTNNQVFVAITASGGNLAKANGSDLGASTNTFVGWFCVPIN